MKKNIITNRVAIIDLIKLLLYKVHPQLLKKIDFNNDNVFLEPLLITCLNRDENKMKLELEEILQGYFLKPSKIKLQLTFNQNRIAYVPNKGYYKESKKKPFEPILKYKGFEIIKEIHPFFDKYFRETKDGHIVNPNPNYNTAWKSNYIELGNAIEIIEQHLPNFAAELFFSNKKIVLHDNYKVLNFTSIETLGMLFFYVLGDTNLIYFIEELIHQGSHNYLYYVIHKRKDYFKIDVESVLLREYSEQQWDIRTIYGAFHGLYTVTQRLVYFDALLSQNVFSGRNKHELIGRLIDNTTRFRTGLHLVNHQEIFTEKGIAFYKELDSKGSAILQKYNYIKNEIDLSNAKIDFRYDAFCELNNYEDFQKKEQNNYYKF